jgi:molybdopterin molybdotransferase
MTGAMLPAGADTVVEVEMTEELEDGRIKFKGVNPRSNICPLGEDIRKGDVVLGKGTLTGVRHIPVLATVGATKLKLYRRPLIGVLATGTELVEPHEKPGLSQIRNSNAVQTIAQLNSIGIDPRYYGIAPDDEEKTYEMLESAVKENDIVMLSGGVSMGEFDFVPSVLKKLGFDLLFQRVAVQPGKPTTFGVNKGKYVFAFPGNPVSSFIIFELLAKPFIYKMMNHDWKPVSMKLEAGMEIKRRKTGRQSWFPVELNHEGKVVPLEYHGSAHIFALNRAIGIASMDIGVGVIREGERVDVRQI